MRILLLLLALVGLNVEARELPVVKPEREGFSAERLERLSDFMDGRVEDGTMVGGLGMIARNGRVVYLDTYGEADREAGKAMTEDALFRIYSMTKPITGVAVLMLYEEGKFFLNDPVARYLPELADLEVALSTADGQTGIVSDGTTSRTIGEGDAEKAGETKKPRRQPTIRDLLTHTAGMTYGVFGNTEVDQAYRKAQILNPEHGMGEFVTRLGKIPLQYEPGTKWHYSVSVDVQGALVEAVSGMSFGEFLRTRIFDPLDMPDTFFTVPEAKRERLAQMYAPIGTSGRGFFAEATAEGLEPANPAVSARYLGEGVFESGGGGLVSSARDYMRFAQMLLNGGELDGARILSPKTVELMTENHLGDIPMGFGRRGVGFGLGVAVVEDTGETGEIGSAGEFNWGGAAGTTFWVDPEENLIGLWMVQSLPHRTRLRSEFKVLTYQALVD